MTVKVSLFAMLRERVGRDTVELEVDDGATVADALRGLAVQHEALAPLIASMPMVMAVNQVYAEPGTVLQLDDELALIPPVSGGATGLVPHARVHAESLSAERISAAIATPHSGAIVTFQGTTRDVARLDYEAYAPMAERTIRRILEDAAAAHEIEGAAAEHRVGVVPLGEPSVIVAVAAAHRGPAFAAAREVIDRIKAEAPIWKREVDGERAEWVEGTPPPTS